MSRYWRQAGNTGTAAVEEMTAMLLPLRCRFRRAVRVVRLEMSEKEVNSLNSRFREVRFEAECPKDIGERERS